MHQHLLLPLMMLFVFPSIGFSDEIMSEGSLLEESFRQWIADWDSSSFASRTAASNHLRDAGSQAFPAIVEAVKASSPEIVSRALALLKSSLHADDESLTGAARESLHKIATGPNPSAARAARQILNDFDRPPPQIGSWPAFGNPVNPINIARRINMWTFNGTTTIEAFENDGKIKIQKDANGRIKVEIAQKRQGVEVPQKFDAANAAELKKKHPAAYQAYQRYEPTLQQAQLAGLRQRLPPGGALPAPRIAPWLPQRAFGPQPAILPNNPEWMRKQAAMEAAQAMQLRLREAIEQRDLERLRAGGAR